MLQGQGRGQQVLIRSKPLAGNPPAVIWRSGALSHWQRLRSLVQHSVHVKPTNTGWWQVFQLHLGECAGNFHPDLQHEQAVLWEILSGVRPGTCLEESQLNRALNLLDPQIQRFSRGVAEKQRC